MPPRSMRGVTHMATLILAQLHDVLNSFASLDVAKAVDVWKRDQEVGRLCTGLFPRASHWPDDKPTGDLGNVMRTSRDVRYLSASFGAKWTLTDPRLEKAKL